MMLNFLIFESQYIVNVLNPPLSLKGIFNMPLQSRKLDYSPLKRVFKGRFFFVKSLLNACNTTFYEDLLMLLF